MFSQPAAAALWLVAYVTAVLCCFVRHGRFIVAAGCGAATAAAATVTLICGGELTELAVEFIVLAALCLVLRGCRREL